MTPDTPVKAYWYGYMLLCSNMEGGVLTVSSKEEFHLDSLLSVFEDGDLSKFEVETGYRRNSAYYLFTTEDVTRTDHQPVRKLATHVIRGMLDARPVARWCSESIDVDLPPEHAEYILKHIPYLKVEYLNNGKVRLYTCTTFNTKRLLEHLYKDAPVARPSRKALYDRLQMGSSGGSSNPLSR